MESSSPNKPRGLRRTIGVLAIAMRLVRDANPRIFALAITMQVISGIGVGVLLFVTQHALGTLLAVDANRDVMTIVPDLVLLVVVLIASGVIGAIQGGIGRLQVEHTVRHVRGRILDVAGTVDLEQFERPAFYDRLQRAVDQGLGAPLQISMGLLGLVSGVVGILGITLALVTIQPVLLPIVALACIPRWLVSKRNIDEMYQFRFGHTPDERARFYLESLLHERDPAKEVRAFSLFGFLKRRWTVLYDKRIGELAAIARRHVRRTVIASVVSTSVIAAMLLLLVTLFVEGQMDIAGVATAGLALQQLGSRLQGLGGNVDRLYESSRFVEDYAAFVALAAPTESTGSAPAPPRFQRLTAEAVTYSYPDATRPAIDGVSLEIRGDEIVALVGENGSGKTTLAKLLCALYHPSAGRIRWDDQDIAACDPRELRESIAVIFQDFVRYQLSVRENIGAGRHGRLDDRDAISASSRAAGAEGFVAQLPAGHDTILGRQFDGGADLSIGQWQRIAMARAFFRDAPFLVLDEPTAALDPRAEQELFTNIRTLCAGRAVLLISHRFSTVRSADRIYVLHEGRLEESGTHDELMARQGRYAELFTLQASAYLDAPPRAVEP